MKDEAIHPGEALHSADALLIEAANGDGVSFGSSYEATSRPMHGVIRGILTDPGPFDEIARAVFIEMWQRAHLYDPTSESAATWILTIAHRHAVQRLRSSRSSPSFEQLQTEQPRPGAWNVRTNRLELHGA